MASELQKDREVIWSPKAEKQWDKILLFYCERNGSSDYSVKLNGKAHRTLEIYAAQPTLGQRTKRKNVRRCIVEKFVLFYRIIEDKLEVIAVVDARRNVPLD